MSTQRLTLQTLHLLSDDLSIDFAEQLEECIRDCRRRPNDDKKREVTIRLAIVPDPDDADDVLIQPIVARKTPAAKHQVVLGQTNGLNQLTFEFVEEA